VYTVKDGKAVEVPVDTGAQLAHWVEVVRPKGLRAGDPVVVEGVNRLAAGVPVIVSQAATSPATRPAGETPAVP
jgi:multidrug efflux pump subunit AcrA (membrane-fusion protein)